MESVDGRSVGDQSVELFGVKAPHTFPEAGGSGLIHQVRVPSVEQFKSRPGRARRPQPARAAGLSRHPGHVSGIEDMCTADPP